MSAPRAAEPSAAQKDSVSTESGYPKSEKPDSAPSQRPEATFREALEKQAREEDTRHGRDISIIKILGGDFFTAQILRRQVWLMLLIACFVIFYISNRYSCQKSLLEIDKLKKELTDVKYKALSTSSRLTEISRQSHVIDRLKENRDSTLHIADQPPFIIQVPEQ
ncbi:MAG: hypothetical protein K2G12_05620 [Prevotella sp.]|nr:hypothetical protein [Prevotella sp.]